MPLQINCNSQKENLFVFVLLFYFNKKKIENFEKAKFHPFQIRENNKYLQNIKTRE